MNNTADPIMLEQMQNKLTKYIENKRDNNESQIKAIESDSRLVYDYLVPTNKMEFDNMLDDNNNVTLTFEDDKKKHRYITFMIMQLLNWHPSLMFLPNIYENCIIPKIHGKSFWQKRFLPFMLLMPNNNVCLSVL